MVNDAVAPARLRRASGEQLGQLLADAGIPHRARDEHAPVPPEYRADSLRELVAGAAFVVMAVPVARMRAALRDLRPHLDPSQVVLDVGSVKVLPARSALGDVLGAEIPWCGTHPLFGPLSLALAERPLRVVVCPAAAHPGAARRVRALYERIGCEIIEQTAEGHDRVMAHTHALTFFIAKGMIDAGAGMQIPFAPPSFQAMARWPSRRCCSDAGHLFAAASLATTPSPPRRARSSCRPSPPSTGPSTHKAQEGDAASREAASFCDP